MEFCIIKKNMQNGAKETGPGNPQNLDTSAKTLGVWMCLVSFFLLFLGKGEFFCDGSYGRGRGKHHTQIISLVRLFSGGSL